MQCSMNEEWRAIPGWEGLYEVSNFARVRNRKGRVIATRVMKSGYMGITLNRLGDKPKQMRLHRAVAFAFLPAPCDPSMTDVNHIDMDKLNNVPSNLEWANDATNQAHATANKVYCPAHNPKRRHKLTPDQVRAIRREFAEGGVTKAELGRRYGCCPSNINRIIIRKWWASVE